MTMTDILWILKHSSSLTYAHVYLALDGSFMERGEILVVSGVGICSVVEEQSHNFAVTERASIVQGDETPIITGMHIRPVLQEELHYIPTTKTWQEQDKSVE